LIITSHLVPSQICKDLYVLLVRGFCVLTAPTRPLTDVLRITITVQCKSLD